RDGTGGTRIGPDGQLCFTVDGNPGDAAVVNLTPVRGNGTGYGLLISSNVKNNPPVASNANYGPNTIDPNVAIATIGTDGQVCYQNSPDTTVDLIADHLGTIAATAYTPADPTGAPERIIDTRGETPLTDAHPECVDPTRSSFDQGTARTMAGLSRLAYTIQPGQQPGVGLLDAGVMINDPDDINDDSACWVLVRAFRSSGSTVTFPGGPTIELPTVYDTEVIVARNVVTQDLAVAFRGTEGDARDIVTDVLATKSSFILTDGTTIDDAVHTGISGAFQSVRTELRATLLANAQPGVAGARVFFTGHSLGGALATVGALDLHDDLMAAGYGRTDIVTYSFGAPRSITTALLPHQRDMQPRVFVVASALDPVPYLPGVNPIASAPFTHAGTVTLIQSRLGTGGVRFDSGPGESHERCLETNADFDVHDRHEYVRRLDAGEFQPPTATLRINGSGNFQTRWTTTIEGPCDDVVLLDGNTIVHRRSAKADGDNINNSSESKGFGYRAAYLDRFGNVLDFSPVYQPTTPEVWLTVNDNGLLPDTIDMHWRVDDPGAKDLVILFDRDPRVVGPDGYYKQFGINRVEADPLGLNNSPLKSAILVSSRDNWWVAYVMEDEDGSKYILDSKQAFGR
ncbi:MAG: lipase family protein, partial [Actinomycetota bacterium]